MIEINQQKSIAVIGGGITGISAAIELAKSGNFQVILFEKENQIGGLCSYYRWKDSVYDRFYHVILRTDTDLLEFIKELGLESELFWREARSGFYGAGKLVSMSSIRDFIRFPFLSLWQKFRMGLGILYSARIRDSLKLDGIYARQWLMKIFGRKVYENIWSPLLRSKLGNAEEKTSAAFIWANITRLYGARSSRSKQEIMGHVHGGYHTILTAAKKRLAELGVKVLTDSPVLKLESQHGKDKIRITTNSIQLKFDKALLTVPCPEVLKILSDIRIHPYWKRVRRVEYLGVVCVLLFLERKLSPYYVINLLDKDLPFTGIIESTNVVSSNEGGGVNLIYLPKYISHDDPINSLEDDEIAELFLEKLKTVFPELKKEEILYKNVFRERYVQPIQELNFLEHAVHFRTPISNLYLVNTSMIDDSTLNNNAAISLAKHAVGAIIADTRKREEE